MRRTFLAALIAVLAVGCADSPPAEVGTNPDDTDVNITIPDQSEGGQTAEAEADANLTLVTLKVPGMT